MKHSMPGTEYRADIDGLRAIAVLVVILFHSGIEQFGGGYTGVDVFFVISGYLITSVICREIAKSEFTYRKFVYRRVARLAPALLVTLVLVAIAGFVVLDDSGYDRLGKQILFASFGAANIHLAGGVDYFTPDVIADPLIHLWSLGVEEQFYLVWPLVLLLLMKMGRRLALVASLALATLSLLVSQSMIATDPVSAYYLPHSRAFELLAGVILALWAPRAMPLTVGAQRVSGMLAATGMLILLACCFVYSERTPFPGVAALLPGVATVLIIRFAPSTAVGRILGTRSLVWVGLVSYPLYLFHQPLLALLTRTDTMREGWLLALTIIVLATPAAYLVYRFIERPVRRKVSASIAESAKPSEGTPRQGTSRGPQLRVRSTSVFGAAQRWLPPIPVVVLGLSLVATATMGLFIALKDGLPGRFARFNSFAAAMGDHQKRTFGEHFSIGFVPADVADSDLYLGDSLMQHYVYPISEANGTRATGQISTATQGGCVLLKSVEFRSDFALNSCDELRDTLYEDDRRYRTVFISQSWETYEGRILNAPAVSDSDDGLMARWQPFLADTVDHFRTRAEQIVIVGGHLRVGPVGGLLPNLLVKRESYLPALDELQILNDAHLQASRDFLDAFAREHGVQVIHPEDLWCTTPGEGCRLHNGEWSYFGDKFHAADEASELLIAAFGRVVSEPR